MKKSILKFTTVLFLLGFLASCDREDDRDPIPSSCQEITEDITQTRTLIDLNADPNVVDYCINSTISIKDGAGLIIEPGVVIEFGQNAGINIGTGLSNGYISAEGTNAKPIRFTGNVKSAGFWRGLYVYYTSNDIRNTLDYCIVEYAGSEELQSPAGGLGYKAAIGVGTSSAGPIGLISIKNSIIQNNVGKGYACRQVGLNEFENNTFSNNTEEAVYLDIEGFSKMDGNTIFDSNGFDGVRQAVIAGLKDKINDGQVHT